MEKINIKIKRVSSNFDDIQLPAYATNGSAGMDVRAAIDGQMYVEPGEIFIVPTNLVVEIPEGYEIQVRARSGLAAKHGIAVLNAPGTIDSDYRGEIKIILINHSKEQFNIYRGDRIAQLVVSKVYHAQFQQSEELNDSLRGKGGFGHTGKQ